MARTFIRQDAQIGSTLDTLVGFVDDTAPAATMESGASTIADDLNNIRSMLSYFNDLQTGNWYDPLTAPVALEAGTIRGLQALGEGLHAIEQKRVLRCTYGLNSITIASAGDTFDILGTGELPGNTTAAVGAVTTLGTVVADNSGGFGAFSLAEVAGTTAIAPYNLVQIVDAVTRDPVLDADDRIYGLLQSETAADGHTITDTTTTRVQISFVKLNGTGDDLIEITSGAMDGVTYDYCYVERVRLQDLNEGDFLGGANIDVPAGATVTRQVAYNNQGTTPVDLTTNATLDLEGAGLVWSIRDDAEAALFTITEGSAGGTSTVAVNADVDTFDVDAATSDFANGALINSGGTRPIEVGVTDGLLRSTAGDLEVRGTAELILNDGNLIAEATWTGPGVKLTEDAGEITAYETNFGGEVSIFNALNQAYNSAVRTKVQATLTANVSANSDINGPGTAHNNTDVDLAPFDQVVFNEAVDVYLNGELMRYTDDVIAGGTPSEGDIQFTFDLKGTGSKPDQITVFVNGQ